MPNWFDTPAEILTVLGIVSAGIAALTWIVKSQIAMMREFRPNGGSSAKDSLNRIERKLDSVESKIDDHIKWHLGD
jgi:hypothetical protein